ncbi:DUF1934 family protein [Aerococcaceae bacterium zg-BR9]|uniref:DUF1934 family protein n=1 Tax=Aerococcaceae bacterium zg-1292 TaxID=2774330 RepID=UPI00406487A9|nr:DUF1934 family protein [Aerococcaceae bacterium zg-BR9]
MEKKQTYIEVQQKIRDSDTNQTESFAHQTEAVLYELSTFNKIVYQDAQKQRVEVKWMPSEQQLEIKYGANRIICNPSCSTQFWYTTGQGEMPLVVTTTRLTIRQNRLEAHYQLHSGEEVIGQYEFRLIYRR